MAVGISGDLVVMAMDEDESKVLKSALKHLWKEDRECLILTDWERGTLHDLMDAMGVE